MAADPGGGPSDEELMRRLQDGEDAALAQLMERWELRVRRFIFRIVGNPADADDLAQEVFVRVYAKRASYHPGAKFSSWCFAIAANQARNRLRWWRRRPELSLEAWAETGGELADGSAGGAPAQAAEKRERVAAVRAAVAALPVEWRTALVLFEYEGLAIAEIGAALACTPKAVENRLYRARQRLKAVLAVTD
ncbi:MAG TPA: RNA polymerase sigma factor [Lacunisphaera sp.]|nr:RNA polymerase sigma factor [Lacunisphaera sp.]